MKLLNTVALVASALLAANPAAAKDDDYDVYVPSILNSMTP